MQVYEWKVMVCNLLVGITIVEIKLLKWDIPPFYILAKQFIYSPSPVILGEGSLPRGESPTRSAVRLFAFVSKIEKSHLSRLGSKA